MIFDLDGTLTLVDSLWSYLHNHFETWDSGKVTAQKYKDGKISYKDWAEADAKVWTGISVDEVMKILNQIPYSKGAKDVFKSLHDKGVKTAIVSAGLSIFADKVAKELGADLAVANELEIVDGKLTGRITVNVSVADKDKVAKEIASQFNIPLEEIALVGDRGNDLSVPECLKIAFRPADSIARSRADVIVDGDDLSRVLDYLTLA